MIHMAIALLCLVFMSFMLPVYISFLIIDNSPIESNFFSNIGNSASFILDSWYQSHIVISVWQISYIIFLPELTQFS